MDFKKEKFISFFVYYIFRFVIELYFALAFQFSKIKMTL